MPESFTDAALIDKALLGLKEIKDQHDTMRPNPALLRFTLAFLYRGGDREPYDTFWREVTRPVGSAGADEFGRLQSIRGALARICRAHGREVW